MSSHPFLFPFLVATLLFTDLRSSQAQLQSGTESGVVRVDSAQEVVEAWDANRHIYVKGNIGVGEKQLGELQEWVAMNGPHWTIVLMEHAEREVYQGRDGRSYEGLDAVEYALGYGLSNQTGFGNLVHPKTNQPDGAVFAIFLRERKFSYFGSDAQDTRRLGEANWIGSLDQPAYRAMRGGGRILDAVKQTVQSINNQLDRTIDAEVEAKKRAELEIARSIDAFRSSLVSLRESVDEVESKTLALRKENSSANGPLSNPPVDEWRSRIKRLDSDLTPATIHSLHQEKSQLSNEVDRLLNAFSAREEFPRRKQEMLSQISKFRSGPNGVATPIASELDSLLREGDEKVLNGDADINELFTKLANQHEEGEKVLQAELRRIENAKIRSLWIRGTVIAMLGLLATLIAILLAIANFRRRPSRDRARQALAERDESVRKETEELDDLFARNAEILGSKERLKERGYIGITGEVANQALDHVDDLFIMSKEVRRVLQEARELIEPRNLWGKLVNLFSSARYERGINHVTGSPLRFSRSGGLPLVLREYLEQKKAQSTGQATTEESSRKEIADEVRLTYEEVFLAFKTRGDDATQAIQLFEDSLSSIQDALNEVQQGLQTLGVVEKELDIAADRDGYFHLPSLFEILIPDIQKEISQADELAAFDSIQAMQAPIPAARRKLREANELIRILTKARNELFPKLESHAVSLKELGYTSDWFDANLDSLSNRANELMKLAAKESIAEKTIQIDTEIQAFAERASTSVLLGKSINESLGPDLRKLKGTIDSTRTEVAEHLKLEEKEVLHEIDRDPDESWTRGERNAEAARTMLLQGRTDAVQSAIDTARLEMDRANRILTASIESVRSHEGRCDSVQRLHFKLGSQAESLKEKLGELRQHYSENVFRLAYTKAYVSQGNPRPEANKQETPDASTAIDQVAKSDSITNESESASEDALTADQLIRLAIESVSDFDGDLESAKRLHDRGEVLASADGVARLDRSLAWAHRQLDRVASHIEQLEKQAADNGNEQRSQEGMAEALARSSQDPLCTRRTIASIEEVKLRVQTMGRSLQSNRGELPNPFDMVLQLQENRREMERLQGAVIGDRQAHGEAMRAVVGATRQMEVARTAVRRSQTDNIPDSPSIVQANARIGSFDRDLRELESALQERNGDWEEVDDRATRLQTDLSAATQTLSRELDAANRAWQSFQSASQSVFQAEKWSGPWGLRVQSSHGVHDLERSRAELQSGNYEEVVRLSQLALLAAQAAIQQVEREVARRQMEEEREAERQRRAQAARRDRSRGTGGIFGGGDFFGSGGFSGGSSSSSSRSSSSSSSSSGGSSGFSRSGW